MRARRLSFIILILLVGLILFAFISLKDFFNTVYIPHIGNQIKKEQHTFNIVLLGYGGGLHEGGSLTDSIIVLSLNLEKKTATLISVPRDLWVTIPTSREKSTAMKINATYSVGISDKTYPDKAPEYQGESGAGNLIREVFGTVTGLKIDYYVALSFQGFREFIDTLGGIDVEVDRTFDDYEYPIDGKEKDLCGKTEADLPELEKIASQSPVLAFPCRYEHIHFDSGQQHFDGASALKFVRSRHSSQDGTDFGRAMRQQKLLLAVRSKILNINFIPKIFPLMDSLKGNLRTDISTDFIKKLTKEYISADKFMVHSLVISNKNFIKSSYSADGQYILIPSRGNGEWDEIRYWIGLVAGRDPKSFPRIAVANGTATPGLAQNFSDFLTNKGLRVEAPQTSSNQKLKRTTIRVINQKSDTKIISSLELLLNTKAQYDEKKAPTGQPASEYDILVTLGQDYAAKNPLKKVQ